MTSTETDVNTTNDETEFDATEIDLDVDSSDDNDEIEDVDGASTDEKGEASEKPAKAAATKKRVALPEGYVTPIGLCKAINEQGLYTGEGELKPQAVYSYIRNAPKAHPFPNGKPVSELVEGASDDTRVVYLLAEGLQWWKDKNKRAGERKSNAAEKATKAAEKAAKPAVADEAEGDGVVDANVEVTEAE